MPDEATSKLRDTLYVTDLLQQFGEHFWLPYTLGHGDLVMLLFGPEWHRRLCMGIAANSAPPAPSNCAAPKAPASSVAGAAALSALYNALLTLLMHDAKVAQAADRLESRWTRCLALDGTWPEVLRRYGMDKAGEHRYATRLQL